MASKSSPLALLAAALAVASADADARALPMTPLQESWLEDIADRAADPSSAAKSELLAALDAPQLRAALARCCPSISQLAADELLGLVDAELASAELVHNFAPVWRPPEHR
eukprot:SAG31_NODE_19831_length_590_cov_1.588595_1_plen_111_part_00